MMSEYRKIKQMHREAVVLIRVGDFYEAFGDDAQVLSGDLGLTMTTRGRGKDCMRMTGFPYHQLDAYLLKLAAIGHKIIVAEPEGGGYKAREYSSKLLVQIDHDDGSKALCEWSHAEGIIRDHYKDADQVLRQLALGHPVRCTFATYQHRDFVEGFERGDD